MDREREGRKLILVTHALMNASLFCSFYITEGKKLMKTRVAHRDENSAFFLVLPAPLFAFLSLYFFFQGLQCVCTV